MTFDAKSPKTPGAQGFWPASLLKSRVVFLTQRPFFGHFLYNIYTR